MAAEDCQVAIAAPTCPMHSQPRWPLGGNYLRLHLWFFGTFFALFRFGVIGRNHPRLKMLTQLPTLIKETVTSV